MPLCPFATLACYNGGMSGRLVGAIWSAASGFLQTIARVVRELFYEITGALFAVFAVAGAASTWREWQRGATWLAALGVGFTVMMAWFAFTSFLRSRRRA